jgi:hypothetical protein
MMTNGAVEEEHLCDGYVSVLAAIAANDQRGESLWSPPRGHRVRGLSTKG